MTRLLRTRNVVIAMALATPLAFAEQEVPQQRGTMPLVVKGQMNLGQAGLLSSYYSGDAQGAANYRISRARSTIGGSTAPNAPQSGYENESSSLVVPLRFNKNLPGGQSFLSFSYTGLLGKDRPNQVQTDTRSTTFTAQYVRFLDPDTMLSLGVFNKRIHLDIVSSGGTIDPNGYGLRTDFLKKFSDHWGFVGRVYYKWGSTDLSRPLPSPPFASGTNLTQTQDDNRLYIESVFKGQYRRSDWEAVPEQWVLRPIFAFNYVHNSLETTADSQGTVSSGVVGDTEGYGTVWTSVTLEKEAGIGQWSPNFKLGIEHEYKNDLSEFTTNKNFGIIGVGVSSQINRKTRILASFTRHQAFDNSRNNQSFLLGLTRNF